MFGLYMEFTKNHKVEIFLEQREAGFLSPRKICENLNFSTVHHEKFKFSQILLGDKNSTYLCSKIISTLRSVISDDREWWAECFDHRTQSESTSRLSSPIGLLSVIYVKFLLLFFHVYQWVQFQHLGEKYKWIKT